MTDQWEFYPSRTGDLTTFVFVNVSIGTRLATRGQTGQVLVRVQLREPREDGLTTDAEFETLQQLEDGFATYCGEESAAFVGRVTVGGVRDFVVYAEDAAKIAHGLRTIARDEHGYDVETIVREDPEFEVYWKHLYPSPVDWQMIQNRQLLDQLRQKGDLDEAPRRIEHWIFFEAESNRDQFEKRIKADGFGTAAILQPGPQEPRFGLAIHREDPLTLPALNEVTVHLARLAQEFGGAYDSWQAR